MQWLFAPIAGGHFVLAVFRCTQVRRWHAPRNVFQQFVGARALTQGKLSALLLYALGGVFGLSGLVIGIVQRLWLLCGFMILVAIVFFILAAKLSAASKETA